MAGEVRPLPVPTPEPICGEIHLVGHVEFICVLAPHDTRAKHDKHYFQRRFPHGDH